MLIDSSCFVLQDWLLIALLQGLAVSLKVSLLIAVKADDVKLVSLY